MISFDPAIREYETGFDWADARRDLLIAARRSGAGEEDRGHCSKKRHGLVGITSEIRTSSLITRLSFRLPVASARTPVD